MIRNLISVMIIIPNAKTISLEQLVFLVLHVEINLELMVVAKGSTLQVATEKDSRHCGRCNSTLSIAATSTVFQNTLLKSKQSGAHNFK